MPLAIYTAFNGSGAGRQTAVALSLRVGAFAVENTLEGATSNADQVFLERPSIAETVRGTFGGDGRSALGVYANGDRLALCAVLTGGLIGNSDGATNDEQTGAVVRAGWLPISSAEL